MTASRPRYRNVVVLLLSSNLTALYALLFRVYDGPQLDVFLLHVVAGATIARAAVAWVER